MKIFYFCPSVNIPTGGIKVIYRHVELLKQCGFDAFVLHFEDGFRCDWFQNSTLISYPSPKLINRILFRKKQKYSRSWPTKLVLPDSSLYTIGTDDIIVIPEVCWMEFKTYWPGIKKVIFNQNGYYTFRYHSLDAQDLLGTYITKDTIACLSISEDTTKNVHFAFPKLPIYRVKLSIDPSLFHYQNNKKLMVSYMPRKNLYDIIHVINLLKYHGGIENCQIVPIEEKSEKQVSEILQNSLIFLSFGYPEGFSLPPAEAMACGCLVVGYHGQAAKEFMRPEFSFPFEIWDSIGIATKTLELINTFHKNKFESIRRKASEFILLNYSLEEEKNILIKAWSQIITL